MHISKWNFQNIIIIVKYQTFSKLAVPHSLTPFTCKPLKLILVSSVCIGNVLIIMNRTIYKVCNNQGSK